MAKKKARGLVERAGEDFLEHLPAAATVVDGGGHVLKANAEARRLSGTPFRGETCRQYWNCRSRPGRCPLVKALRQGTVRRAKVPQGGDHGCAIERISVFKDSLGRRRAIILTGPATAHFKRLEALRSDARYDGLSRVLNRRGFEALTEHALKSERRQGSSAFLMLDIDNLKRVNDGFGHTAGDRLIERLGRILSVCARRGDIVGRVGGDEFAIYCPGADRADARRLARRIEHALHEDNMAHPTLPYLGVQIGLACTAGARRGDLRESADRDLRRLKSLRGCGRCRPRPEASQR